MAQRVAGGERHYVLAGLACAGDPSGHLAQGAVHVFQHGAFRQLRTDQFQRTPGADYDASPGQALAGGIRQAGPAVVENADQAAIFRGLHLPPHEQ